MSGAVSLPPQRLGGDLPQYRQYLLRNSYDLKDCDFGARFENYNLSGHYRDWKVENGQGTARMFRLA